MANVTTDQPPKVVNANAQELFRSQARDLGLNPDDRWVGGYVAYAWEHDRYFFQSYAPQLAGRRILEFGCNVGASSIILASLGAEVVGVEIDRGFASLANAQASVYGLGDLITIQQLDDTRQMPFSDEHFDIIVCNSVLEYVQPDILAGVQREMLRVLAPGGLILIMSTSNRLWPREVHSGRWLSNYIPRALDALLGGTQRQRGVSPFTVLRGFKGCTLLDSEDGCATYLRAKQRMGMSSKLIGVMRLTAGLLRPLGLTVGMLTPSFSMALRKQGATG